MFRALLLVTAILVTGCVSNRDQDQYILQSKVDGLGTEYKGPRYEYIILIDSSLDRLVDRANQYGQKGWEVCGIGHANGTIVLKRQIK